MPYSEKEYQVSNVNYLNKDFSSLKSALIEYAKTYFPNSYRDFNETSPGMMLIEMSAYVGDVLSFYVDNQYKEMLLPLAEERRNVINLANMLGYKIKPTTPAIAEIDVSQTIAADLTDIDNIVPDFSNAHILDKNMKISSNSDSTIIFETLDVVDFTISSSITPSVSNTDENGLATEFTLTRKVKAVSGETKTKTFSIGSPEKFKRITLPDTNIFEILSVVDSSGNKWYEVEYLAQDKVPSEEHYYGIRNNAYYNIKNDFSEEIPVPYTLEYVKVPKRFITEINDDNTTSIVFGNGLLHEGFSGSLSSGFFQTEQVGITIPGENENINSDISPIIATTLSSLGESPSNTTLTVTYRVGGGISSNVSSGDLISLPSTPLKLKTGTGDIAVTNLEPARGGADEQSIEEIKRKTQGNFITQKRCVTKEDYEARILALPSKFGNIAKVSVNRVNESTFIEQLQENQTELFNEFANLSNADGLINFEEFESLYQSIYSSYPNYLSISGVPSVEIHILSYDNNKNLVESPELLMTNLSNYLNEFRMITDEFAIYPGKVVNFGVAFEIVAHKYANKQDVKLKCINSIIDYFNIDKMKFRQPIFTSDLIYQLMGIEGVRSVVNLELTQGTPTFDGDIAFDPNLFKYSVSGDTINESGTDGYNWKYDFENFYNGTHSSDGTILPSVEPTVFELKNPNENIRGVVR